MSEETFNILFVANNYTALSGMIFLISEMKKKYSILPVLVCEFCYYETDEYEVFNLTPDITASTISQPITNFYNQQEKNILRQVLKFINNFREMAIIDKKSKEILYKVKPQAIVVYCDRMGGIVQGFLKNAKGIPTIKVPIAVGDNPLALFESRYYNEELRVSDKIGDINRLPLMINSNWGYTHQGETRLFYPVGYTMAGYLKRMISMYPWISGAGDSTHVLAVTEEEKEKILSVVQKQVITTGLIEDYYIVEKYSARLDIRRKIKEKYDIKSDKIVVLSMPQIAEHNMVPWQIHRENMSFVVSEMSKVFGKILISLHPKSREENYSFLHKYGNIAFLRERLRDVIVGIDILAVVSSSSVMRWADILGTTKIVLEIEWLTKKIDNSIREEIVTHIRQSGECTVNLVPEKGLIKNVSDEIIRIINES